MEQTKKKLFAGMKRKKTDEIVKDLKKEYWLVGDLYSSAHLDGMDVYANISDQQLHNIVKTCGFMTFEIMTMIKAGKVNEEDLDRLVEDITEKNKDEEELVVEAYSLGFVDSVLSHFIEKMLKELGRPDDVIWKAPFISGIVGGMDKYRESRAKGMPDALFFNCWTFAFSKAMIDYVGVCQMEVMI